MSTPVIERRNEPPLRVLRRHWPVAAAAFAAIWIAVSAFALALPVKFSVNATVQVYPVAGGQATNSTNVTPVNISTEARTASSDTVLAAAAKTLGGIDVPTLRRSIEVDAPDGSQNLVVVGTAASAETATARANAVAQAYLAARGEMASSIVDAADAKISGLITTWNNDPALRSRVGELELSRAQLGQVNTVPGVLIDPAVAGRATANGRAMWGIAAGAVLGLLGAAAAVLWRERASKLASDAGRVAAKTGHRVLDWDGDAEGVRRLLLGLGEGRSFALTGDALASERFAKALAQVLRERGDAVIEASVDDAEDLDAGRTERALLRAGASGMLVANVDPELGFSRFVRLSRRSQVILVVSRRSRLEVVRSALTDLGGRDGVSIVFARGVQAQAPRPEASYRNAADRALAFELAAKEARGAQGSPEADGREATAEDGVAAEASGVSASQRQGKRAAHTADEAHESETDTPSGSERRLVVALSLSGPAGAAASEDAEPGGTSTDETNTGTQRDGERKSSGRGGEKS